MADPKLGVLDTIPTKIFGHFNGALEQMKKMQPNKPGTFPANKNARNALWNKLTSLPDPELTGIANTMAEKANHQPGEKSACEFCKFVMEHMPDGMFPSEPAVP